MSAADRVSLTGVTRGRESPGCLLDEPLQTMQLLLCTAPLYTSVSLHVVITHWRAELHCMLPIEKARINATVKTHRGFDHIVVFGFVVEQDNTTLKKDSIHSIERYMELLGSLEVSVRVK